MDCGGLPPLYRRELAPVPTRPRRFSRASLRTPHKNPPMGHFRHRSVGPPAPTEKCNPAPDARGPQRHTATRHDLQTPGGPAPPHEAGRPSSLGVARYEGRLWSYSTGPPCCGLRILARQRPYPSASHPKDTLQPGQGAVGAEAVIGGIHVGVGEVLVHRNALGDGIILTGT